MVVEPKVPSKAATRQPVKKMAAGMGIKPAAKKLASPPTRCMPQRAGRPTNMTERGGGGSSGDDDME